MKKKITPERFEKIKQALKITSRQNVAAQERLSIATINRIGRSDDYDEYINIRGSSQRFKKQISESGIKEMTGEPLFWQIHTMFKNIPNKILAQETQRNMLEISAMKRAKNYQDWLENKDAYINKAKNKGFYVQKVTQEEIYERHNQGESVFTLAEIYNLPVPNIIHIIDSFERRKDVKNEMKIKKRKITNWAIAEIVRRGREKGITNAEIAATLGLQISTISVIKNKKKDENNSIYVLWKNKQLYPQDRRFYRPDEDFYMFSLRKYLGIDTYPFWWKDDDPKTVIPEETESPEETVIPEEKAEHQEEHQEENQEENKVLDTTTTVPIVAEAKRNGANLTLTITINLNM